MLHEGPASISIAAPAPQQILAWRKAGNVQLQRVITCIGEHVLQHLAGGLERDRERGELAGDRQQLGGPLPLLPQRRASPRIAAGEPLFETILETVPAPRMTGPADPDLSLSEKLSKTGFPWDDVIPVARALIDAAPDRVVWATLASKHNAGDRWYLEALGIDGVKEAHEKIRRKEGSWDKAIHTARTLQQMKNEQYPQLDIQTCTCVMHSNEDTIFDWYDFLKYDLKPDKVNINYIRPPSADPKELEFDHRRYAELSHMILEDTKSAALKNNYGGKSGFFKAAVDIYMHDLIAKTKEENKAQLKCYAGSAGAVIYDNGVLSSCENKPDVLSLRDYDWDFQAAWKTDLMKARRVEAGAGCHCTHESNCYYPSLPFNPGNFI